VRFRTWQLERIDVEPDEPPARLHAFQDRTRVTIAADPAIDSHLARVTADFRLAQRCRPISLKSG